MFATRARALVPSQAQWTVCTGGHGHRATPGASKCDPPHPPRAALGIPCRCVAQFSLQRSPRRFPCAATVLRQRVAGVPLSGRRRCRRRCVRLPAPAVARPPHPASIVGRVSRAVAAPSVACRGVGPTAGRFQIEDAGMFCSQSVRHAASPSHRRRACRCRSFCHQVALYPQPPLRDVWIERPGVNSGPRRGAFPRRIPEDGSRPEGPPCREVRHPPCTAPRCAQAIAAASCSCGRPSDPRGRLSMRSVGVEPGNRPGCLPPVQSISLPYTIGLPRRTRTRACRYAAALHRGVRVRCAGTVVAIQPPSAAGAFVEAPAAVAEVLPRS